MGWIHLPFSFILSVWKEESGILDYIAKDQGPGIIIILIVSYFEVWGGI